MTREIFLLDLSDETLASEYDEVHQPGNVPAGVLADIRAAGIRVMEIYRHGDRLVMITETDAEADAQDRVGSEESRLWEARMDRFQRPVPGTPPGTKWQPAKLIFNLEEHIEQD